jgi:hypothetical protein
VPSSASSYRIDSGGTEDQHQAREALTRVAGRHTRGKIVLQIGQ